MTSTDDFGFVKRVVFSPRPKFYQSNFEPSILRVSKNAVIELTNCGTDMMNLNKQDHIGDIREAISNEDAAISKLHTMNEEDFVKPALSNQPEEVICYTADVLVDPDKMLQSKWRDKFGALCQEFSDIMQYKPGTYNDRFGYLQNTVELQVFPLQTVVATFQSIINNKKT